MTDPWIGRTIGGRYRLIERIGAGGTATVYRARHEAASRDVAVKLLAAEGPRLTTQERFLREARAANDIPHPNVIDITDVGFTDEGATFLVMDLLTGAPLSSLVGGPMLLERALGLAVQVARALESAHARGIVHRDIKPANVFVQKGDFVKVLDFGIARLLHEGPMTATGVIMGTPSYMAPEQTEGRRAESPADIYSLGCVLFELVTGHRPFRGRALEVMNAHVELDPPTPSATTEDVPPALDELVLATLDKDPARRPSAGAVVAALESMMGLRTRSDAPSPSLQAWERLVALVRRLVALAHPDDDAPSWVAASLSAVQSALDELLDIDTARRVALGAPAIVPAPHEVFTAETPTPIGSEKQGPDQRFEEILGLMEACEARTVQRWRDGGGTELGQSFVMTPDVASWLASLGDEARRWATLQTELIALRRAADEGDAQTLPSGTLDARAAMSFSTLVAHMRPIVGHLEAFEHVRMLLPMGRATPVSQRVTRID